MKSVVPNLCMSVVLLMLAVAGPAAATPILLHGTGEGLTQGQLDSFWSVELPDGTPFGAAISAIDINGSWITPTPPNTWVSIVDQGAVPAGVYQYSTTFMIDPGFDPGTAEISGYWWADEPNPPNGIYLNGVQVSDFDGAIWLDPDPANAFFSINSGFVAGLNVLTFRVESTAGPGGTLIQGLGGSVATIPEPGTLLLVTTGLIAAGFQRRRMERTCRRGWLVAGILAVAATASAQGTSISDPCTDGDSSDIRVLSAQYEPATQEIVVTQGLCGPVDNTVKYRVRFDDKVNQVEYPRGSGNYVDATITDGNPYCLSTSDAGMMWKGKATGPGTVTPGASSIEYRVGLEAFQPPLAEGNTVYIWADTQKKGIRDRAPDTDGSDGCERPQTRAEVLTLILRDPNAVIGTQAFDILRDPTRLNESAMGNMVSDAMRGAYAGVDAALTNSGGLRADLLFVPTGGEADGEITWFELLLVLPFSNRTVILTLTGAQLETALLNGFSPACNAAIATGRFPQVSGLAVSYHCAGTTPVIDSIATPGGPVGPGDAVRLVTNDFLYAGGDNYVVFGLGTNVVFPGDELLELTVQYIAANSPVAPVVEGRIVQNP